jgi:hypothetical protein
VRGLMGSFCRVPKNNPARVAILGNKSLWTPKGFSEPMYRKFSTTALWMTMLAAAAVAPAPDAIADTPRPSGILWIDWATEQIAFALQEAAPASPTPAVSGPARLPATHSIESIEINRLREEIRLLRDLIEQGVVGRVVALENEVRMLRGGLQQQQISNYGSGGGQPQPGLNRAPSRNVPIPREFASTAPMPAEPERIPVAAPEAFRFTVVDEWGRTPEVAAELGGNASTLIGLAGIVPPGSAQDDVVALVRDLREDYEAYDNINIEIFDSERAAQDYAAEQSVDSSHHVASISRHKSSGRDLIIYLGNGKTEPVVVSAK